MVFFVYIGGSPMLNDLSLLFTGLQLVIPLMLVSGLSFPSLMVTFIAGGLLLGINPLTQFSTQRQQHRVVATANEEPLPNVVGAGVQTPDALLQQQQVSSMKVLGLVTLLWFISEIILHEQHEDEEDAEFNNQEQAYKPPSSSSSSSQDEYHHIRTSSSNRGRFKQYSTYSGDVKEDTFFESLLVLSIFLIAFLLNRWPSIFRYISRSLPREYATQWRSWMAYFGLTPTPPPRGSVPADLERIKDITLEESHFLAHGPVITCAICLENLRIGNVAKRLPCNHFFHKDCVVPWLERHNTCPTCRHELETAEDADDQTAANDRNNLREQATEDLREVLNHNNSPFRGSHHHQMYHDNNIGGMGIPEFPVPTDL